MLLTALSLLEVCGERTGRLVRAVCQLSGAGGGGGQCPQLTEGAPSSRFDESLWQSLDLTGKNLHPEVIGRLLSRGVVAFCCPRSFVDQPLVEHFR